tara:strand:+ start:5466 stop:5909 length:444 start_codon:yes stop_codon:yes gene_type:complete
MNNIISRLTLFQGDSKKIEQFVKAVSDACADIALEWAETFKRLRDKGKIDAQQDAHYGAWTVASMLRNLDNDELAELVEVALRAMTETEIARTGLSKDDDNIELTTIREMLVDLYTQGAIDAERQGRLTPDEAVNQFLDTFARALKR